MVGLELPVLAMEHQYLITGDMPELAGKKEQLHAIDFEGEIYMRQERGGMLHGHLRARRRALVAGDDAVGFRPGSAAERSRAHRPEPRGGLRAFSGAGQAPASGKWSTDRSPSRPTAIRWSARSRACKNFWVACGVMAGFSQGGGVGSRAVALDGRRRSGRGHLGHGRGALRRLDDAGLHQRQGARELLAPLQHPLSERGAPRRAAAAHHADLREARRPQHAVFGDYCALEHPLWFAPSAARGRRRSELPALERPSARGAPSAARCATASGLLEISNYGKFEVRGPGAAEWLSRIMANRVPAVGRIALTPMLNERGKLIGDFTMCRVAQDHIFLIGTYAAETYYMRWFERHLPPPGVSVRPCAMEYVGAVGGGAEIARAAAEPGAR